MKEFLARKNRLEFELRESLRNFIEDTKEDLPHDSLAIEIQVNYHQEFDNTYIESVDVDITI